MSGTPPSRPVVGDLTASLLRPVTAPLHVDQRRQVAGDLEAKLAAARSPGPGLRVTAHQLAVATTGGPLRDRAFCWTARSAARTVGLRALRSVVGGTAGTALEAASLELDHLRRSGAAGGSLGCWMAELSPAGRATVVGEAVTWATRLWGALDWERIGPRAAIGPPDRWWRSGGPSPLALRGRADLAVPADGAGGTAVVLLSVLGGVPRESARLSLGLAALVGVLQDATVPVPGRVVGWWPDCGRVTELTVEHELLEATADAVLRTAGTLSAQRRPIQPTGARGRRR